MSSRFFQQHCERLRAIADPTASKISYRDWILENTRLGGEAYSFKDHEFQDYILSKAQDAPQLAIKKPSQIGISELIARLALAICNLNFNISLAYTLPTASFSQKFAKTRVDTIILGSPAVKSLLMAGNDSSLVKQFLNFSLLYFIGASRVTHAISTPLDGIIYDEFDFFEDMQVLTTLTSRLKHSKLGMPEYFFSTPTVPKYGITKLYDKSKQHAEIYRCNHCNHEFFPDYYKNVRLPGFDKPLEAVGYLTSHLINDLDLSKAYIECPNPKCQRPVSQELEYRRWICLNPSSQSQVTGIQITPFSAPKIQTPGQLILNSTKYARLADFVNFELGLEHADRESEIQLEELQGAIIPGSDHTYSESNPPPYSVAGLDMGGACACHIGYPSPQGPLIIVHSELIPLRHLKKRYAELCKKFRIICTVADGQPYTDLIIDLQGKYPNLWAALFPKVQPISLYAIRDVEEDDNKAFSGVKAVSIARHKGLDQVISMIRSKYLLFEPKEENVLIFNHIRDMKRVKIRNNEGEESFVWRKGTGVDHYFFALLYLFIAFCIKGLANPQIESLPLVHSIRTKGKV